MKKSKLFRGTKVSRNHGLFLLEHWKRDNEGGWTLDSTRSGGSKRWAELVAQDLLKPVHTTKHEYYRDMGRSDFVTYYRAYGSSKRVTIAPRAIIVPSVGELGYW